MCTLAHWTEASSPTANYHACRLYDFVPAKFTGRPNYYIVHAHNASFQGMLSQVLASLASSPPAAENDTFLWLDIFATSQHLGFGEKLDIEVAGACVTACEAGEDFNRLIPVAASLNLSASAQCPL